MHNFFHLKNLNLTNLSVNKIEGIYLCEGSGYIVKRYATLHPKAYKVIHELCFIDIVFAVLYLYFLIFLLFIFMY